MARVCNENPIRSLLSHIRHWYGDRSRLDRRLNESLSSYSETIGSTRKATVGGKLYLIDAQVARKGVAWADKPWIPPVQVAALR